MSLFKLKLCTHI